MRRLYLTVEGQTEQAFCTKVLEPHLRQFDVHVTKPRFSGPGSRRGGHIPRGGFVLKIERTLADIARWLKEDASPDACFSTMFDLHHLPADCPGTSDAARIPDPLAKAVCIESALAGHFDDARFVPYLSVHEFEALVFARPEALLDLFPGKDKAVARLIAQRMQYLSPEHVDGGQHSHPSHRIRTELPDYDKVVDGVALVERIGLPVIRAVCRHFDAWLTRLEALGQNPASPG